MHLYGSKWKGDTAQHHLTDHMERVKDLETEDHAHFGDQCLQNDLGLGQYVLATFHNDTSRLHCLSPGFYD